jgi:rare lipoprotein A
MPDEMASATPADPFAAAAAIERQKAEDNPNDGALASAASIDADTPDVSNFRQSGKASWYGNAFHGRRTASGERYDMHEMTAAHMSLPLLSYVRVTNLLNSRSVVVRINDRGPFHGKRILDLSLAAAKALGIQSRGTGNVMITGLSPSEARVGMNQSLLASR